MKYLQPQWLTFVTISIGTFMSTSSAGIVNTALPTMSRVLDQDLSASKWIVSSFLLTISALLPVVGRLSDMYGSVRLYNLGFFVFVIGSGCIGASNSLQAIVVFRILQAVGATMMVTNNVPILSAAFQPEQRGRAIGLLVAVVGVGSMSGPALSGLILQIATWRWLFWLDIPLGLIGGIMTLIFLPRQPFISPNHHIDILEAIKFAMSILCLILMLSQAPQWGWFDWRTLVSATAALVLGIWFVQQQKYLREPLLDLELFKDATLSISAFTSFLSFTISYFTLILMPFYLDQVLNMQPSQIGLLMTYYPLVLAISSPVGGWVLDRYGASLPAVLGSCFISLGQLMIAFISSHVQPWQIMLILMIQGLGMGLFSAPNNTSIIGAVPREKMGTGGSILAFVRVFGQVTGATLGVALFELGAGQNYELNPMQFLSGYRIVSIVGFGFGLMMLYFSYRLRQPS